MPALQDHLSGRLSLAAPTDRHWRSGRAHRPGRSARGRLSTTRIYH
jgi:hypothetical protein